MSRVIILMSRVIIMMSRVTLFGDSAGAASAGHLMLSQEPVGLFHQVFDPRAFLSSFYLHCFNICRQLEPLGLQLPPGPGTHRCTMWHQKKSHFGGFTKIILNLSLFHQEKSEACSRQIAAIVGCTQTDPDQLVDCLRSLSYQLLLGHSWVKVK